MAKHPPEAEHVKFDDAYDCHQTVQRVNMADTSCRWSTGVLGIFEGVVSLVSQDTRASVKRIAKNKNQKLF